MDKPLIFPCKGSPSHYLEADLQAECPDLVIIHRRVFCSLPGTYWALDWLLFGGADYQLFTKCGLHAWTWFRWTHPRLHYHMWIRRLSVSDGKKTNLFFQAFFSIRGYRECLAPGWCPCGICRRGSHNNWGIANTSEALLTEEDILQLLLGRYEQNFTYTPDKTRTWSKKHLTQVQVGEPSLFEFLTEKWMRGYCRHMDDSEAKASSKPPT